MIKILLISDDKKIRDFCSSFAQDIFAVDCIPAFPCTDKDTPFDFSLILFDFSVFDKGDLKTVRNVFRFSAHLPVLVLACEKNAGAAAHMLKAGAADIIILPCSRSYMFSYIRYYTIKDGNPLSPLHSPCGLSVSDDNAFKDFIGISSAFTGLKKQILLAAGNSMPVLLLGETGTGKSRAARLIHDLSNRKALPFVEENIAAVQETLMEAELFGTKAGAYTGAVTRMGLFEKAEGGTLFLDEIGCISLGMQAKLLRALETGEIRRVGDCDHKKVDIRIICATNSPLNAWKESGEFRKDLYYRITGIEIHIPSLAERTEDILPLARSFLENLCRTHNTVKIFSDRAEKKLESHLWPGNIRELQSCICRAFYETQNGLISESAIRFVL
ncbi:sigma 54-interacting transcriptional regulator [Treponema sp. HNW]|uniref:sigma 54-interacting transcriptional regulator n=1 Tax=Treponema sp. HNW TaxID=3116654 RepID=UPI003D0C3D1A